MLVGKLNINPEDLKNNSGSFDSFCNYAMSCLPKEVAHYKTLYYNQLYYNYKLSVELGVLSKEKQKELGGKVLDICRVAGYCNQFLEIGSIINNANQGKLEAFYRGDNNAQ